MGPYTFYVRGCSVPIENERLIDALLEFGDTGRSILLLSCSINLTDKAIGELLNISRSRVSRYKAKLRCPPVSSMTSSGSPTAASITSCSSASSAG